jgi:hypothetical protein
VSNPPKQKGTAEETSDVRDWWTVGRAAKREPAGAPYDVHVPAKNGFLVQIVETLATRSDRGERMVTMRHRDFRDLIEQLPHVEVHEEVKRYSRFALHSIFEKKFGR